MLPRLRYKTFAPIFIFESCAFVCYLQLWIGIFSPDSIFNKQKIILKA